MRPSSSKNSFIGGIGRGIARLAGDVIDHAKATTIGAARDFGDTGRGWQSG